MGASSREQIGPQPPAEIADYAGADDDDRKGYVEEEDGDEGTGRERDHERILQRTLPIRTTASITTANTAALMPKKIASTNLRSL